MSMSEKIDDLPPSPPECPLCGCNIWSIGRDGIDTPKIEHPDTEGCVLDEFRCTLSQWHTLTRADAWKAMAERLAPLAAFACDVPGKELEAQNTLFDYAALKRSETLKAKSRSG